MRVYLGWKSKLYLSGLLMNWLLLRKMIQMERVINLQIEKLPEGVYLATSDTIQGLVAQGRTITETLEIARDVAKKLIESQEEQAGNLIPVQDSFTYPLVIGL